MLNEPPNSGIQYPQVRSLFSKYENIDHYTISNFISSVPNFFSEAANIMRSSVVNQYPNSVISECGLNNRLKLQKAISNFHRDANTFTSKVYNAIENLNDPITRIFVSTHQPNLFAYGGIFKKIVLLQTLKYTLENMDINRRIINLFVVIDHDFMDETWIRLAQLPSVKHHSGILDLRFPIDSSKKWLLVCNMPLPGRMILYKWKRQITSWIRSSQSIYKFNKSDLLSNLDDLWSIVEDAYSNAKSYSEFNSIIISNLVNKVMNYDTLFVRLTDMSSVFEDGYRYLISNFKRYTGVLEKARNVFLKYGVDDAGISSNSHLQVPLWLHCKCGSKASIRIHQNNDNRISFGGPCMSCKKNLGITLENIMNGNIPNEILQSLTPKAIPILLLLSRDLGISCYCSGSGGVGYMAYASIVCGELGIKMPFTIFWPARDINLGMGQTEALDALQLKNQDEVVVYLQRLNERHDDYKDKITPIIEERSKIVKSKNNEQIKSILSDLFSLKQEQREIRRLIKIANKVNNALELRPSIIDYAINFGIAETEMQWRNNLLTKDNLAAPIIISKMNK
jgi:hypothetical protein